ncbi:hypothetical protein Trydic_g16135 [Trypoxylus dichotomus]
MAKGSCDAVVFLAENIDGGICLSSVVSRQNASDEKATRVCSRNLLFTSPVDRGDAQGVPSTVQYSPLRAVVNVSHKRPEAERTIRTPANTEAVRASVLRSPRRSTTKHAAAPGLSDRSIRRIVHDNLHIHPYKINVIRQHAKLCLGICLLTQLRELNRVMTEGLWAKWAKDKKSNSSRPPGRPPKRWWENWTSALQEAEQHSEE